MKLYDIPRDSIINVGLNTQIKFHHLDGMYSYCTVLGTDEVCHIPAITELELQKDGTYNITKKQWIIYAT